MQAVLNAGSKRLRSAFYVLCGVGNGSRPECGSRKQHVSETDKYTLAMHVDSRKHPTLN